MFARFRTSAPAAVACVGVAVSAVVVLGACGSKGGGDVVRSILCGSGHTKGLMSVGLNFKVLEQLGVNTSNVAVRQQLNSLISKVDGGSLAKLINVAKVESVDKNSEDDSPSGESIRFLELGGTLGGLGTATKLLFEAVGMNGSNLAAVDEGGFFSFARESFRTGIATHVPDPRDEEFRTLFAPHTLLAMQAPSPKQWAYAQTDFAAAMAASTAKATETVIVAVIDTGVDLTHPDLKDVLVKKELWANFVEPGKDPQDGNGHGTHCAGIIAGQGNNGGPVGVASALAREGKVKIMPVKVLGDNGSGDSQAVEKGIRWAVKNGADVISMSLGGGRDWSDARREGLKDHVIADALDTKNGTVPGAIVVVAAGNESCPLGGKCKGQGLFSANFDEYIVHPCSYEGTICVGATNADETLASYSNYSSKKAGAAYRYKVDVNAPGTNIYSTWPVALSKGEPYKAISGTSMATPLVAGLAAIIRANNKNATQAQVKAMLQESQVRPPEIVEKSEEGRVDILTVAKKASGETSATPPPPQKVEDPNKSADGQPLGLVSLWQAICAAK